MLRSVLASTSRLVSFSLVALVTVLAGCPETPPAPDPVIPQLTPGVAREDVVAPGASTTLQMTVKAQTFYAVWLSTSGAGSVVVTLSGTPLAAPLEVRTNFLSALSGAPQATFYAAADGLLDIVVANAAQSAQGGGLLTLLLGGNSATTATLRIDELGTDDHGEKPEEATTILPDGTPLGGELLFGEAYDYFTLPAEFGDLFNFKVEATHGVVLATTNIDSFGRFNFNVPTNAGNQLALVPRPGVPATNQFVLAVNEPTGTLSLAIAVATGLLAGSTGYADYPIEYAITVEKVTSQQLQSGNTRSGSLEAGFTAQYFIDVPTILNRLEITLSGPDGLAVYVKRGEPASFESFDFYRVLGAGIATDTLTIAPFEIRADRYYLTVDNLLGEASNYILTVHIR